MLLKILQNCPSCNPNCSSPRPNYPSPSPSEIQLKSSSSLPSSTRANCLSPTQESQINNTSEVKCLDGFAAIIMYPLSDNC